MHRRSLTPALAASFVLAALLPGISRSGPTTWAQFPLGAFPPNTPTTVSMGAGSTMTVTVTTGGTQGINGADLDTVGTSATGLQYENFGVLGIFNGGGSGTVLTQLTFTNIQVGALHLRGLMAVGAINAASSPVTVGSTVAGRVQTWTVVGSPFDFGPSNSFPVTWDAISGTIHTDAEVGNDSRVIVLDLGDLRSDGDLSISLSQYLNDGIIFSVGEEQLSNVGVPAAGEAHRLAFAAPLPNPARDATTFEFTLPASAHARIDVFDLGGRRLARLADAGFPAGSNRVGWNLMDDDGTPVPAGLYLARLDTEAGHRLRRVVVIR